MAQQFIVPLYHLELVREKDLPYTKVDRESAAAEVFHQMLDSSPVEKLAIIHCNTGMDMIGAEVVCVGSVERVGAIMSELFKGALLSNATEIWMAHNHVDGVVTPSMPDYSYTLKAVAAGSMLGIRIRDHLVIAPGAHYSIFAHREELNRAMLDLSRDEIKKRILGMLPVPGDPFRF